MLSNTKSQHRKVQSDDRVGKMLTLLSQKQAHTPKKYRQLHSQRQQGGKMLGKERMKGSAQRGSRSSSPTHKSTTSSEARSSLYTYGELLHVGVGGLGPNAKGIEPSRGSKGREEILQLIGTSLSASVDTYEDQQPEPKEDRTGVKPSGKSLKQDVSTK